MPVLARSLMLSALLLSSTSGCRPSDALTQPSQANNPGTPALLPPELPSLPPTPSGVVEGFVALTGDGALYSVPGTAGRMSAMHPAPGTAVVWRVIEATEDFISVESLPPDDLARQCVEHDERVERVFDRYQLRAHLRTEDLSEVIASPTLFEFPDGSRLMLGAGLPITFVGEQTRFEGHGLALDLPLTHQDLRVSWTSAGHGEGERPALEGVYASDGLSLAGAPFLPKDMASPLSDPVGYEAIDDSVGRWTFMNECVRINPVGPPPRPAFGLVGTGRGGGGTGGGWVGGSFWVIPAHTPARWPDTNEAGQSLWDQRLPESEGHVVGDLVCFELWAELEICHERGAITLEST